MGTTISNEEAAVIAAVIEDKVGLDVDDYRGLLDSLEELAGAVVGQSVVRFESEVSCLQDAFDLLDAVYVAHLERVAE